MTLDALAPTCPSSRLLWLRPVWALATSCLFVSLSCSADGDDAAPRRAGSAGAAAAGSTDGRASPDAAGDTAPATGVEPPVSTERVDPAPGGLAGAGAAGEAGGAAAAAPAPDAGAPQAADGGAEPAPADAGPDPSQDENVVFIQEDGFQTTYFALECRSVGEDGSVIEDPETLPVGAGRSLQCTTGVIGALATQDFLASTNERWCALGALDSATPSGDPRLSVQIADAPADGPWTLVATSEEPIELGRVILFGASTWPVWVESHHTVVEVVPNPSGQLCDTALGS